MEKLQPLLNGDKSPGLYRFSRWANAALIAESVEARGWCAAYVDGREVTDKGSFIGQFAQALSFPDYHGTNWDAFEDCVTDLAWIPAPGYVILYDYVHYFAWRNREEWQMACSILTDATRYWHTKGRPMYVLLRHSWWLARNYEVI